MQNRRFVALAAAVVTAASLGLTAMPASAAAPSPKAAVGAPANVVIEPSKRMPTDVPSKKTPWVADGEVTKIMEVGNTMVAGGLFTTVQDPMNGTSYTRQNLFTWDKATGLVNQNCNPTVDGQVQQLLPGPTPGTVYVAGDFTKINGKGPNHLQLIDVNTCQAISSFKAPSTNGGVETMELLPNNRLFIGGFFTKIAGVAHGELAVLNATTGALDPTYMDIDVSGHHNNTGSGAQGPVGIRESGVTPDGSKLVVVGNFRTMAGVTRNQIAMIDLGPTAGTMSTAWNTTGFSPVCSPGAFDSYMRDVEMSPDGSYFVVATTGGPHAGTLCDAATRWETNATGTTLTPTWTANSGGDTLWGVGISDAAVFVGGHDRWMNNANGSDSAGQASVPRPGLSALDPQTGVPLKWNPGRNPRGEAAYDIYDSATGVWVVSDTDWIGDRRYQRKRIAFFPYDTGYNIASTKAASLPGNVYIGQSLSSSNVLYRVNAGGSAIAATDNGPDWGADTSGAPSTFHNTGSSTATQSALTAASLVNVPATTPLGIWTSERNDPTSAPEMQWSFPVAAGTSTQVRLYFASRSSSTRTFNVSIDGVNKLAAYNPNVDPGVNKGTMKSFDITSDGTVNIDFGHIGSPSPLVNAIEIINNSVGSNATSANVVAYDGTTIGSQNLVSTPNLDWTNVRGAVMVGRSLFYGLMTGTNTGGLYKRTFDGTTFGDPVLLNPYQDPLWNTVLTGSGPATQTYSGVLPTWYTSTTAGITQTTGMFYWNGRLYYTKSGQNNLYWRWFVPDSGIVGAVENTLSSTAAPGITWSNAKGMFIDGSNLYVVSASDGSLSRINFANGTTSGSATVVNSKATGGIDWRGRALFLSSVLPNVAPTAGFTYTCAGVDCTFTSTSSDPDGSVVSYDWDFGDGEGDGNESPTHSFLESGTYTVTLEVTDDQDSTGTITQQVTVEKPNVAPTAAYTVTCVYLDCTFDGTSSTDSDGTVTGWAWDFGDGDTGNGANVPHTFDNPGTYSVQLTATDDDNATNAITNTVTVTGAPVETTVTHVASAVNQGNVTTPNVTTPAATAAGNTMVMILTLNANNRVLSAPTGVTGWTLVDSRTAGNMASYVYTKTAMAADANKKVTVTLDAAAKYTMTVGVYAGVRGVPLVTGASETVNQAGHSTPTVNAPAGAFVASYWADKSTATTGFTLPGSVTGRAALCSTGTGHICSTFADSAGAVPTGSYGGLTATADTANQTATMYTIVMRKQEANILPTAAFTQSCTSLTCSFDASASSDSDGSIVDYAWDFGDGHTAGGPSPSNDFPATGSYDVTLTVTDNEGGEGSTTASVSVTRTNAPPTAAFSQNCSFVNCTFDSSGSGDTDGTIASYAWDFGDGNTSTDANPVHGFGGTGSYQVSLTVTDNDNASTTVTKTVNVTAAEAIAFVGSATNTGNVSTPNAVVPATVTAGDRLFMVLSVNANNRVLGTPTGVTGWNLVDTATTSGMATTVYTKVAAAADAGKTARVPMDLAAKYTMTLAAYSGDMLAPQVSKATETVATASHTTPTANADAGAWVVSYWADKSSATTQYTLPGGVVDRGFICGTSTGRICSDLADGAGPSVAGQVGGLTAVADSPQANATMWTIVMPQAG